MRAASLLLNTQLVIVIQGNPKTIIDPESMMAFLINYSAAIIDIFNFYLAEKTPLRNLTEIDLVDDTLWGNVS